MFVLFVILCFILKDKPLIYNDYFTVINDLHSYILYKCLCMWVLTDLVDVRSLVRLCCLAFYFQYHKVPNVVFLSCIISFFTLCLCSTNRNFVRILVLRYYNNIKQISGKFYWVRKGRITTNRDFTVNIKVSVISEYWQAFSLFSGDVGWSRNLRQWTESNETRRRWKLMPLWSWMVTISCRQDLMSEVT